MARVLLAEDDDFAAMVVGALLKKQGVKHELASSGEDCITRWDETASTDPYDMVLLDWELGDMTGLDVLKHIKKRSPDTTARLIMVSGNEPSSEERAEFQEAGAEAFLTKPITAAQIQSILGAPGA